LFAIVTGRNYFPAALIAVPITGWFKIMTPPGKLEYLRLLKLTAGLGSSTIEGLLSDFLSLDRRSNRTP
jgi:hypothetical protein